MTDPKDQKEKPENHGSTEASAKVRIVRCPACHASCRYDESNEWRPFCSRHCKDIDTIAWANEEYAVPGRPADPEELATELAAKRGSDGD